MNTRFKLTNLQLLICTCFRICWSSILQACTKRALVPFPVCWLLHVDFGLHILVSSLLMPAQILDLPWFAFALATTELKCFLFYDIIHIFYISRLLLIHRVDQLRDFCCCFQTSLGVYCQHKVGLRLPQQRWRVFQPTPLWVGNNLGGNRKPDFSLCSKHIFCFRVFEAADIQFSSRVNSLKHAFCNKYSTSSSRAYDQCQIGENASLEWYGHHTCPAEERSRKWTGCIC